MVQRTVGDSVFSTVFGGSGEGRSERYIEYGWILSHLSGGSILDVGAMDGAGTVRYLREQIEKRGIPYTTLDLITEAQGIPTGVVADIRESSIADGAYDDVTCISTLEHIEEPERALAEMFRIAAKQVLVTMPFGKQEKHLWGIQYDYELLSDLLAQAEVQERTAKDYFGYFNKGWERCSPEALCERGYGTEGAPYAAGCVCLEITK